MTDYTLIDAEALVRDVDERLTIPGDRECLPCYLHRMIEAFGCDNHLRWAENWRCRNKVAGVIRWLNSHGGYCDCEVLFNVYPQCLTDEKELRPCLGVARLGSRQPCRLRWNVG